MENTTAEKETPLLSYWVRPRQTIRFLLQNGTSPFLLYTLIPLFGIVFALDQLFYRGDWGDYLPFPTLVGGSLLLGIPIGFLIWFLYSGLFWGIGKLLGGTGEWREMRITVAWASLPFVGKLMIWCWQILLFQEEMFTSDTPSIDGSAPLKLFYILLILCDLILNVWYFLHLSKSIGEVHQYSAWRGGLVIFFGLVVLWCFFYFGLDILIFPW